jgi:hypothetical protein
LRSNLVFRFAVGGIVGAVLYAACAALWRAWHRRLLKLRIAGQGLDPGEEGNADEIRKRDLEVAEFMGTTTNAIAELKRRIEELERER